MPRNLVLIGTNPDRKSLTAAEFDKNKSPFYQKIVTHLKMVCMRDETGAFFYPESGRGRRILTPAVGSKPRTKTSIRSEKQQSASLTHKKHMHRSHDRRPKGCTQEIPRLPTEDGNERIRPQTDFLTTQTVSNFGLVPLVGLSYAQQLRKAQ